MATGKRGSPSGKASQWKSLFEGETTTMDRGYALSEGEIAKILLMEQGSYRTFDTHTHTPKYNMGKLWYLKPSTQWVIHTILLTDLLNNGKKHVQLPATHCAIVLLHHCMEAEPFHST